jgi:hypothetical protein
MSGETVSCPVCLAVANGSLKGPADFFANGYVCGMLHTVESATGKEGWGAAVSDVITKRFCERHARLLVTHVAIASRVFAEDA